MWKKIFVFVISIVSILSFFSFSNNYFYASASAKPIVFVEGKKHTTSTSRFVNADWETNSPYLSFDKPAEGYVILEDYNPALITYSATFIMDKLPAPSKKEFILANVEFGGAYLAVKSDGYEVGVHVAGAYQTIVFGNVVLNKETTITVTYDEKVIKAYVNGTLTQTLNIVGNITPAASNTCWAVGVNPLGNDISANPVLAQYFNGKVKSASVYGTAFTAAEVKNHYDYIQQLYNPEVTFVKDNKAVTNVSDINTDLTLSVSNKYDLTDKKTSDVAFCILDSSNNCNGTSDDVLDIIDNRDGTVTTKIHKGGTVKVRATHTESTLSGIYTSSSDVTLTTNVLESSYTPMPQNGKTNYEFSKNVGPNTVIGKIAFENYYQPNVVISIKPSLDSAHANDYINFAPVVNTTTSSPIDIKIVNGGTADFVNGSLKAKTYKFVVEVKDGTEIVRKEVTLVVEKTTPTISFSTTTQKDMIIGDSAFIDIISTSNTDTLTVSDVSYSLSGGIANALTVSNDPNDPMKYKLDVINSHGGIGLPTTYDLKASIKETDNYKAITTTSSRKIYVYKELSSLTWSPSKGSFSTTDVNATNSIIGTLLAVDGVGPYTYEVVNSSDSNYDPVSGADSSSFTVTSQPTVANTSVQVKTTTALSPNTYQIQFKVTDAKGKSVFTNGTITVSAKGQAALDFKDKAGGTIITTTGMKVKFDDIASKLIAEGGTTSGAIQYDYAPQSMQPGGVNPSSYATINQASGLISPIRIGTIKVQATRPGDATYDPITAYMMLTIEPAPQIVDFNDKSSVVTIAEGKTKKVDAKGSITSSGAIGKGGITYASSDTSIATVDPVTGDVTGIKAGNVIITATLNSSDPSNTNFEANYDTVNATKAVKVYEPMKLNWVAVTLNLKAEANAIGNKAGTISVTNNASDPNFAISLNSTPENTDSSFFQIVDNGASADLKLAKPITASDWLNHGGSFKVQVDVSDINGTQTIDIIVVVDEASNVVSFTENGKNITSLTKKYGENGNTFNLTSVSSNGGIATYSVIPDPNNVLNVSGTGLVTIKSSGTATVQVLVSSGNGYAQQTVTMPITIEQGDQAIAYKDTTTLNQKFTLGATFKEEAELKETSASTLSGRTITYTSNDTSICTVDAIGTITMLKTGICDIDALNNDSYWKPVSVNKKINLYDGMGVTFVPTANLQAEKVSTSASSKAGSLTVSGGIGNKTYAVSTVSDPKNTDASLFQVNSSGVVSFKKAIMASDLVGKYNSIKKVYELHVQFETTDSGNTKVTTDAIVEVKGAPLKAEFDTNGTGKITEVFGSGKTFTLSLSSNKGNGVPNYQLKKDSAMPNDVLSSVDATGLVTIQHANDPSFVGNPLMVEAVIPANDGYDEETIEVEVEITKAPQPDFAFKTPNIKIGTGASYTPLFTGNLSSGTITMHSPKPKSVRVSGSDLIAGDADDVVTITADDSGDRDYQSAVAQATVTISSAPSYSLIVNVPSATYGNTGLKATAKAVGSVGTNPNLAWSSSDSSIATIDASGNITILKAGSVVITCVRTTTGEPSVTSTATLDIDPKPITVVINNVSKYVGEALPAFSAVIPTADLVGSDTLGQPTFSCKDGTELVQPETKAGTYDITGAYPTSSYPNYNITVQKGTLTIKHDPSLPTWFHLEGDTSKTKLDSSKWHNQDVNVVLDPAVESAGTYNEISLNKTLWDKTSIKVINEGENSESVTFRIDASDSTHPLAMSTPQPTTIKIDKTKPVIKSITGTTTNKDAISSLLNKLTFGKYFKPGTKVSIQSEDLLPNPNVKVSGVKSVAYEVFEIDRTTGKIGTTPIATGELIPNASGVIEVTMNDAGLYRVCAIPSDHAGNVGTVSCSDLNVKNIGVDIDKDGKPDNLDPNGDGCPDIDIVLKDKEDKFYKVNVDRDGDNLPDLNIDSDGDGKADINIDTDEDGKPDLNLLIITKELWKPTYCVADQSEQYCTVNDVSPSINVDTNDDGVPELDIDIDGDFKPDFNITTDGKKPSINVGILHDWKPNKDGKKDAFSFDTMELEKDKILTNIDTDKDGTPDLNVDIDGDGRPDINVDTDGDWIPNINVDTNGDGKSDVNVDTNKDGKPDENIIEIIEWNPEKDCEVDGFKYDTMAGLSGKDQLEDNDVIVTKPGGVFLPNFALKVNDVTKDVSDVMKNDITNKANGQVIDSIFDVKLTQNGIEVQPDGKLVVRIPIPNNLKNPHLVVQQADGTYIRVTPEMKDGYLVYETDYLGKVAIIKDYDEVETPDNKVDEPTPNTGGTLEQPKTSVKGYYNAGANTGDSSQAFLYISSGCIALAFLTILYRKQKR